MGEISTYLYQVWIYDHGDVINETKQYVIFNNKLQNGLCLSQCQNGLCLSQCNIVIETTCINSSQTR